MFVFVFVVCCVGSGVFDKFIIRSEECYRARVRACVCVGGWVCVPSCDLDTSKRGGISRIWATAPHKNPS